MLSVLVGNLVESSLDDSLEFGDEDELLSSALGGGLVLSVEDTAEFSGVVPKELVSLLLVGGSLGNGGLAGDASGEVLDLSLKAGFLGLESADVTEDSFLLLVESGEGDVVVLGVLLPAGGDGVSEGLEEGLESLDGGLVLAFLILGELDEGVHDGLVLLGLSELDGVSEELAGDLSELDEGALSDSGDDVEGVIDGVDGIVEGDGGLVVDDGLVSSDVVDEGQVLSVLDEDGLGEGELGLRLVLLELACSELEVGSLEGVLGVEDLGSSVGDLGVALVSLSGVDLVVGHLLLVDGILEAIEDSSDDVSGATSLELVLDLNHNVHYGSSLDRKSVV